MSAVPHYQKAGRTLERHHEQTGVYTHHPFAFPLLFDLCIVQPACVQPIRDSSVIAAHA